MEGRDCLVSRHVSPLGDCILLIPSGKGTRDTGVNISLNLSSFRLSKKSAFRFNFDVHLIRVSKANSLLVLGVESIVF